MNKYSVRWQIEIEVDAESEDEAYLLSRYELNSRNQAEFQYIDTEKLEEIDGD